MTDFYKKKIKTCIEVDMLYCRPGKNGIERGRSCGRYLFFQICKTTYWPTCYSLLIIHVLYTTTVHSVIRLFLLACESLSLFRHYHFNGPQHEALYKNQNAGQVYNIIIKNKYFCIT